MRNRPVTAFRPGDRVHLKGHAHTPATTGTVIGQTLGGRLFVQWDDSHAITPHHPQHLEPAGEPMSTTFTSATNPGCEAAITPSELGPSIRVRLDGVGISRFIVPKAAAPAFALGILEAAGVKACEDFKEYGTPEHLSDIAFSLSVYITKQEIITKEAAEQEALEGEALDFLNAFRAASGWAPTDSLQSYDHARHQWIAVAQAARKARELHGVTK